MAINKRIIRSNDEGGAGLSFNTVTYTGDSTTDRNIDVGFQPDLVWIKARSGAAWHNVNDSVRGSQKQLYTNSTVAETSITNELTSFNNDGFTLSSSSNVNAFPETYVAWCWKAGGAAVTNTDGTITSQVSANTGAGFSIVTGSVPASGLSNTYGHGLNDTPKIVISKRRDNTSDWIVSNNFLAQNCLRLNTTDVAFNESNFAQTSTTIKTGYSGNAYDFVAYCFAEVAGFSKFDSYTGTGAAGNFQDCGFEPAFVMIKRTDVDGSGWYMLDNKRSTTNVWDRRLEANNSNQEYGPDSYTLTTTSSGWEPSGSFITFTGTNASGGTFIYMAFANQF